MTNTSCDKHKSSAAEGRGREAGGRRFRDPAPHRQRGALGVLEEGSEEVERRCEPLRPCHVHVLHVELREVARGEKITVYTILQRTVLLVLDKQFLHFSLNRYAIF